MVFLFFFFFSSRRRHTRCGRDWSSDVCSSDLAAVRGRQAGVRDQRHPLPAPARRRAGPDRAGPRGVPGLDRGHPQGPGGPRDRHGRHRGPDRHGPHRRRQRRRRRPQGAARRRLQGVAAFQGRRQRRPAGGGLRWRRARAGRRLHRRLRPERRDDRPGGRRGPGGAAGRGRQWRAARSRAGPPWHGAAARPLREVSAALDGVLVCDKPAGMTSHDVVARVRRLARQRRVGHGGTLDPPATGVLVIALGRATRLLPFLPMEPKRYLAVIAFGAETDTLDAAGSITATVPADGIDQAAVESMLARFTGRQQQVPPMVSAFKQGGERLYLKARRGETVAREPRLITVHALERQDFRPAPKPCATVAVTCSGGTYVRVLAADLGRALGSLAHLVGLRRTAVGAFTEAEAHALAELEARASEGPDGLEAAVIGPARSEERRVGKECRSRWSPYH